MPWITVMLALAGTSGLVWLAIWLIGPIAEVAGWLQGGEVTVLTQSQVLAWVPEEAEPGA